MLIALDVRLVILIEKLHRSSCKVYCKRLAVIVTVRLFAYAVNRNDSTCTYTV